MVSRKKKTKISEKVSHEEDRISQLPEPLICHILSHLPTEEAIKTSVLSTTWRNLWRWIPELDLDSNTFSNRDAFVSFVERFFDSHRESWIRKLRLNFGSRNGRSFLTRWIDAVTTRRIQHLDVNCFWLAEIPLSLYTCETLVHLRLSGVVLAFAEFVSLSCLKIMHLEDLRRTDEITVQTLISGSPVLEDLKLVRCPHPMVIQVRSHTVKRIEIDLSAEFVIDAPLLQCLRTKVYLTKNFQIINSGFPAKLDIDLGLIYTNPSVRFPKELILDILTDIWRVRDLAIGSNILKEIWLLKPASSLHFCNLSRLNARFFVSDLELLPTVLESCPKLESLILEVSKKYSSTDELNIEQKVEFSTVPRCLASSLKFVEFKRSIPYEGEMELVRYFLKNSTILEKLRFNTHNNKKPKYDILQELLAMPRCSSACELLLL